MSSPLLTTTTTTTTTTAAATAAGGRAAAAACGRAASAAALTELLAAVGRALPHAVAEHAPGAAGDEQHPNDEQRVLDQGGAARPTGQRCER